MEAMLLNRSLPLPHGSVLRNRRAKAAMSETLGTFDNRPAAALVALYGRWEGLEPEAHRRRHRDDRSTRARRAGL